MRLSGEIYVVGKRSRFLEGKAAGDKDRDMLFIVELDTLVFDDSISAVQVHFNYQYVFPVYFKARKIHRKFSLTSYGNSPQLRDRLLMAR